MTSANFYTGYSNDKPSSKVFHPPGGRSSNIFGCNDDQESKQQTTKQVISEQKQSITSLNNEQNTRPNCGKKRSGFNPITGKSYEDEDDQRNQQYQIHQQQQEHKEVLSNQAQNIQQDNNAQQQQQQQQGKPIHTSSKVSQPPGGRSTKLW